MALTTPALPALATRNSITLALLNAARVIVSLLSGSFGDQLPQSRVGGPVKLMPREAEKPYARLCLVLRG
jgi:hypothetical protein